MMIVARKIILILLLFPLHLVSAEVAVDRLIIALDHPLWSARRDAAESLAAIGSKANPAIPRLVESLSDIEPLVRRSAARALGAVGNGSEEAAIGLITALQDGDWVVRREAAFSLGILRTAAEVVVPSIRKILGNNESNDLRQAAALALSGLAPDSKEALPELVAALQDENWQLRAEVANALGKMGYDAKDAVPELAKLLLDTDWRVVEQVVESLSKIGHPAVPALINALNDSNITARWASARALGAMGNDAIDALVSLAKTLQDKVAHVQWSSARAIWSIAEGSNYRDYAGKISPLLIEVISNNTDWVVRWSAVRALGAVGDPARGEIISALADALSDPDSRVCEAAAFALEQMGKSARNAIPALAVAATTIDDAGSGACMVVDAGAESESEEEQQALAGLGWTVRWTAVRALGVVGAESEAALLPLTEALEDGEWQVRGVAVLAIGQFDIPVPVEVINAASGRLDDDNAAVRKAAAIALGEIGRDARSIVPELQVALDDEDESVREAAREAILKISGENFL